MEEENIEQNEENILKKKIIGEGEKRGNGEKRGKEKREEKEEKYFEKET